METEQHGRPLAQGHKALNRRIADIRATKIFDNLLDLIEQELMAGPDPAWENARNSVLTYDIADWIGCSLDVVPEHVYLHDACKRGVEMALSRKLPSSQRYVCIGELPEEWRGVAGIEALPVRDGLLRLCQRQA